MATERLEPRELRAVARGYIIGKVRHLAHGHESLFEHGLRLYTMLEEHARNERGGKDRIAQLQANPLAKAVLRLVSRRAQGVVDAAVAGMRDNRLVMDELERRAAATGVRHQDEAEQLYRDVLVDVVPLDRSLANVRSIADTSELAHEMLTTRSLVGRALRREGYAFVRRVVIRDQHVRSELDALWHQLLEHPDELRSLAATVREHGPDIVRDIYGPTPESERS